MPTCARHISGQLIASVLLLVFLSTSCHAQTDFFWSEFGLNQGAENKEIILNRSIGDIVTLYLYYTTNGPIDSDLNVGAFLDVSFSAPGHLHFLNATAYDFDILVGGNDIGLMRLLDDMGAGGHIGVGDLSQDFIDEWFAFTLTEPGIREANAGPVFVDAGFDMEADAFLWGAIEIQVVSVGFTEIIIEPGDGGIVNDMEQIFPTFGFAAIQSSCGKLGDLGDMNDDGSIDLLDVQPFIDAVLSGEYVSRADVNCDGSVDLQDVAPFVDLLTDW